MNLQKGQLLGPVHIDVSSGHSILHLLHAERAVCMGLRLTERHLPNTFAPMSLHSVKYPAKSIP